MRVEGFRGPRLAKTHRFSVAVAQTEHEALSSGFRV